MRFFALVLATALASGAAQAAVIKPFTTSSSSNQNGAFAPEWTINGSGLTGSGINPAESHAPVDSFDHWTSGGLDITEQFIVWNLLPTQSVGGIYIWNHVPQPPGPGGTPAPTDGQQVTLFDLTITAVGGGILLLLDDVSLSPSITSAQFINFGSLLTNIDTVRLDVEATKSSPIRASIAEVAFETTLIQPIPLPAAAVFLLGGLGAMGALRLGRGRRTEQA